MALSLNKTGGNGAPLPRSVLERFDIISWDPRGTGQSHEVSDCFRPNQIEKETHIFLNGSLNSYFPITSVEAASWWNSQGKYAKACSKSAGKDLLPFISTADAANDLELLRRSLIVQPGAGGQYTLMNYYGMSYGTALGVSC